MAENLEILEPLVEPRDEVDRILDAVLNRERFLLLLAEKRASLIMDAQEIRVCYLPYLLENDHVASDIWFRSHWGLPQSRTYTYPLTVTTSALSGSVEEGYRPRQTQLQEEAEKLSIENTTLRNKILMLQKEVLSFYDMVKFAAIVVFFLCTLSIPVWLAFDIRILSPLLSIVGIMGASTFWVMSWFGKQEFIKGKTPNNSSEVSKSEDLSQS